MNITIRLTKVEYEMLKELQKMDKRYKRGLDVKVKSDIVADYQSLSCSKNQEIGIKVVHPIQLDLHVCCCVSSGVHAQDA